MYNWIIAGFAGSVLTERLATQRNERVLLIDRRSHIAGNTYDSVTCRSLPFEHVSLPKEWHQPVPIVNYPMTEEFTRVTEYIHHPGEQSLVTRSTYEYPSAGSDPYYPIPNDDTAEIYRKYETVARATEGVWFVGRLATYRDYIMDQVVGQALATLRRIDESLSRINTPSAAVADPVGPTDDHGQNPINKVA